jgi:hypothetical protein
MEKIIYILAILFLASCGGNDWDSDSSLEPTKNFLEGRVLPKPLPKLQPKTKRQLLYDWSKSKVGQKETHGKNRSPFIDTLNRAAKVPLGSPYCGSFVGYGNMLFGFDYPKSFAWSPTWADKSRMVEVADTMDVFTIYYPRMKRVGHTGYHISTVGSQVHTREANTNDGLSREGDGIYDKRRKKATIYRFTRWD